MLDAKYLKNVHRILPNRQTMALTPQNPAGPKQTVAGCVRRPINQEQLALLGGAIGLESKVSVFLVPDSELKGTVPKNGDKWTDADGDHWNILRADWELEGSTWRLSCVKRISQDG